NLHTIITKAGTNHTVHSSTTTREHLTAHTRTIRIKLVHSQVHQRTTTILHGEHSTHRATGLVKREIIPQVRVRTERLSLFSPIKLVQVNHTRTSGRITEGQHVRERRKNDAIFFHNERVHGILSHQVSDRLSTRIRE